MRNRYSSAENNKAADLDPNVSWIAMLYLKNEEGTVLDGLRVLIDSEDNMSHLGDILRSLRATEHDLPY